MNPPLEQMEVHNFFKPPSPLSSSTIKKKESERKETDRVLRVEIGQVIVVIRSSGQCRHSGHSKQWLMD